jgi:type III pantothenate kinase
MNQEDPFPLLAVDVGNSRIKLGLFEHAAADDRLPKPSRTLLIDAREWDPVEIALWLAPFAPGSFRWYLASVNDKAASRLTHWLAGESDRTFVKKLTHEDLPLVADVERPERVGIDRLLGAVAANHLRPHDRPAVVIDLGTAITVDVVSRQGTFCGGAILPGIEMSARALSEFTERLPDLGLSTLENPPPALGTSTDEAIASGLFWGAIGAIRTLIEQLNRDMDDEPLVVLTGGAAESITDLLQLPVCYQPHLVLAGIALAASDA